MTKLREDIRNVAIIAHVDHGKTTLVDELLKQSHTLDERKELDERAMDSNDLEKERGITILAKNTAVAYNGTRINIMDTPGHADFGGEVERIMKMVDGVVLVVDAYEGTMPQTRFVLKKALEQNLTPIVVVNKIDKPSARPEEVVDEVLELFIELGADDDQLEFPVVYASAINGTSSLSDNPADQEHTMAPIFDTIIDHIPAPVDNSDEPLQFQVSLLDYNDFVGRIGIGRIFRGTVKVGDQVTLSKLDGFNITIPHKQAVIPFLDEIDAKAEMYGSVNTVSNKNGISKGYTTDPDGFLKALDAAGIMLNGRIVIIGCGGVARTMAYEVVLKKQPLLFAVRKEDLKIAEALCDEIRKTVAGCDVSFCLIDELSGDIDVLINATPIGMFPKIENQPVSDSVINRCANVFDAVYNPLETMLVKKARANGATAESGMAMLVWQAVVSHEHWDGSVYDKGDIAQLCIDSAKELKKNF